jgi:DNA-directed RNA polymerase specialized sigma24 family protein
MNLRRVRRVGIVTSAQFKRVIANFPKLSDTGKEAARLVLVDGWSQADIAERLERTPQQVGRWVNDVLREYEALTK